MPDLAALSPPSPQRDPWASRPGPLVVGAGAAGLLGGLAHGCLDTVVTSSRVASPLFGGLDAVLCGIFIAGLLSLAGAAIGLAGGGVVVIGRLALGAPGRVAALAAVAASAPVWLLNGHVRRVAPALYWCGLLVGTAAAAGAAAWLHAPARSTRARRAAIVGLSAAGLALYAANTLVLPGLYRAQHETLTWLGLATSGWAVALIGFDQRGRRVAGTVLSALGLVLWLQTFVLLPDNLGQLDRSVIVGATTEAGHIVGALGLVADLDGDGVGAVLGGGDCDDLDASVHPGADDRPGDGIDQDCLGGDPTTARQRALAASRTVWRGLPPERPEKLSLVVISVDALRVDRAPGMEAVQRLAARGVSFEHAYAPYPSTILTFSSIFTGRAPSAIPTTRVMKWLVPRDDPSETLAATLARQGYRTTGLFFHHLFQPEHGLSRGFDEVWTESGASEVVVWGRSSADSTRRGLAALDAAAEQPDTPFFLWVHYYDPHEPYVLHPEVPAPADDLVARYDAEVAYTDQHMLGLIDRLLEGDLLDRTVVALTADHGESLGEQGRRFHASSLADEQVRVPLIIAGPGIPRGQTRQAAVSLMDLAPTLSAEVGASAPRHAQGTSFGQLLRTPATPDGPRSPVFLELHADGDTRWGVVLWPWKLVYFVESHRFELFDLERDPAERLNVYDLLPAQAQQLEAMLGDWISLVTTR